MPHIIINTGKSNDCKSADLSLDVYKRQAVHLSAFKLSAVQLRQVVERTVLVIALVLYLHFNVYQSSIGFHTNIQDVYKRQALIALLIAQKVHTLSLRMSSI